jgi:hypothetical protein
LTIACDRSPISLIIISKNVDLSSYEEHTGDRPTYAESFGIEQSFDVEQYKEPRDWMQRRGEEFFRDFSQAGGERKGAIAPQLRRFLANVSTGLGICQTDVLKKNSKKEIPTSSSSSLIQANGYLPKVQCSWREISVSLSLIYTRPCG